MCHGAGSTVAGVDWSHGNAAGTHACCSYFHFLDGLGVHSALPCSLSEQDH